MTRFTFSGITALVLLLILGCNQNRDSDSGGLPRFRLGYFPNITHAPALVGVQRGDFAKALEGKARFESVSFNAGPSVIEALYAGHLDIAYIGPSPALNGYIRSGGREVRVIAGGVDNGVIIVGNPRTGISSIDQLKGRRIATPQLGNTQDISARHYLTTELGANISAGGETRLVPIPNPDIENLMRRDQLDAAWVPEPWASRLILGGTAIALAPESDLWPEGKFELTVVIARAAFLEQHPELVRLFLESHINLIRELEADALALAPVMNAQIEQLTHQRLPDDIVHAALGNVAYSIRPNLQTFEIFRQWAQDLNLLPTGGPATDGLFDLAILESILNAPPTAATSVEEAQ